jgi:hypothetical protein
MTPVDEQVVEQREQLLITELLGETVKVRNKRYKTMREAVIDAQEVKEWQGGKLVETGKYRPVFNWKKEARSGQVRLMPRLDVMTRTGWATVWDDGEDDLSLWDQGRPSGSAAPTNKKYRSGML